LKPKAPRPKLVKLLGGYLGDPELEREAITKSLDKGMFDRLDSVKSFQCRLQLLIQATNFIPNYKNRINRPDLGETFAREWDDLVMQSTTKCFGYQHGESLDDITKTRVRSARDIGGLGLRSLLDHRYSDFIASLCDATKIIKDRLPLLKDDLASWFSKIQSLFNHAVSNQLPLDAPETTVGYTTLQAEVAKGVKLVADNAALAQHIATQRPMQEVAKGIISNPMDIWSYNPKKGFKLQASFTRDKSWIYAKEIKEHLDQPNTPRSKVAAFTSIRGAHASAWILARPSNEMILDNTTISVSLCNRFDTKFLHIYNIPDDETIDCPCNHSLDNRDAKLTFQHVLSCPRHANTIKKHDGCLQNIQSMFNSCGIQVHREVRAMPQSGHRPDMVVPEGIVSKRAYILELSYVNERSKSYTKSKNFRDPGNAANYIAFKKSVKYASSIDPQTQIFQPIICELSGTMNKEGLPKLIEFLAAKFSSVAHFSGEDDTPKFTTYWYSRFSTWLQICNANAVTRAVTEARKQGHVPDFPLTIRDVQNVLATDEDCEDSYFEDEDEVAALESSA
jgi:hypothetical protein